MEDKLGIEKLFKNKTQMIIYFALFIIFMIGFIYFGTRDYSKEVLDNEKFALEHKNATLDNIYTYIGASNALSYIKSKDAIILFGNKDNEFVTYYANILNDVAKSLGITQIYYYDITDDRKTKNATYESIVNYLKDYVTYLDDRTANIYGPTLLVKKGGLVILFDDEDAYIKGNITAEEYFTPAVVNLKKGTIEMALKEYMEGKIEQK